MPKKARTIKGKDITPYWHTLKKVGVLNEKHPGGAEAQKMHLEREEHKVITKWKKYVVLNYEKSSVQV